jgi:hypothetical protein
VESKGLLIDNKLTTYKSTTPKKDK